MSTFTKQLADVYFDQDDHAYRAVVEFFSEQLHHPVVVPVEFAGTADESFAQIRDKAFEEAKKHLTNALTS